MLITLPFSQYDNISEVPLTILSANTNMGDVKGDQQQWPFYAMIHHANSNGQKLLSLFIDLESAFPRVWHNLVLQTLHELSLRGQLPASSKLPPKPIIPSQSIEHPLLPSPASKWNTAGLALSNTLIIIALNKFSQLSPNLTTQFSS